MAWARQAEKAEALEFGRKASLSDEDAAIALKFARQENFPDQPESAEPYGKSDPVPDASDDDLGQ
jgi:hypothetical protein